MYNFDSECARTEQQIKHANMVTDPFTVSVIDGVFLFSCYELCEISKIICLHNNYITY